MLVAEERHNPSQTEIRARQKLQDAAQVVLRALQRTPPDIETVSVVLASYEREPWVIREIAKIQIRALDGMFDNGNAVRCFSDVFSRMRSINSRAAAVWYETFLEKGIRLVILRDSESQDEEENLLKKMYRTARVALRAAHLLEETEERMLLEGSLD